MTPRQLGLLKFVRAYVDREGVPPSFEEMKAAMGLASKSGIHRLINALQEQGCVAKSVPDRQRQRNWELTAKGRAATTESGTLASIPTRALEAELARRAAA